PRTSRFVIGVRASTRHISASLRIPDGLRVTFTPQTFVKEVIHSGNLPSKDGKYSLYCAVIVKKVDAKTRGKVGINELLRTID
ncbi:hypothetical protein MJN85_29870, partial [Salmonella enterica subsp. enterica serovar Anatum]|nr:hypothetical protein [Salmonella enterica subsp. enterica serovar Anatum]